MHFGFATLDDAMYGLAMSGPRVILLAVLACGCGSVPHASPHAGSVGMPSTAPTESRPAPVDADEATIRQLIDQLVFEGGEAADEPVLSPGIGDDSDEYRRRHERCQKAFKQLSSFKERAFPYLVAHLDDKRPSINFRNHDVRHSVGDACYWTIHFQLQDRPKDYSSYGYQRKGRDGKWHPKPYWEGTPFDEAGGLREWLEVNKALSYPQMQIKCLKWLLEGEKEIGAGDAESYFEDILPLEIQILRRRMESGEDVGAELERLRAIQREKRAGDVPSELLPPK